MTKLFTQCQLLRVFLWELVWVMIKYLHHLNYGIAKDLMQSTLGKDDAILPK